MIRYKHRLHINGAAFAVSSPKLDYTGENGEIISKKLPYRSEEMTTKHKNHEENRWIQVSC